MRGSAQAKAGADTAPLARPGAEVKQEAAKSGDAACGNYARAQVAKLYCLVRGTASPERALAAIAFPSEYRSNVNPNEIRLQITREIRS